MVSLIVYQSRHGSTKQYAKWLSEEIKADIVDVSDFNDYLIDKYDTIIFGSCIYFGRIKISKTIKRYWNKIMMKRIILFSVSGHSPSDAEVKTYLEKSLPYHISENLAYFPLWGRIRFKDLNMFEKLTLTIIGGMSLNEVKKENLKPVIDYIRTDQRLEDAYLK